MAPARPRTTVVIPTRDRWGLLPVAVGSALAQDGVEVDVVVVDDGSVTPLPGPLPGLGDRVRVTRFDEPRGLAAARNAGFAVAEGDWIAFLDDDDVWSPHKLSRQIDAAGELGSPWAYTTAVMIDVRGTASYLWPLPDPEGLFERLVRSNAIPAGSSNVVVSAELLRSTGGFDESFSRIADWDLWLRLADVARPAALDEPLVGYRQHAGNMSGAGRRELLAEFARLESKHGAAAAARGLRFDRAGVEEWADRESRRRDMARADAHLLAGRRMRAAGVYLASALQGRRRSDLRRAVSVALGGGMYPPAVSTVDEPDWLRDAAGALSRPADAAGRRRAPARG